MDDCARVRRECSEKQVVQMSSGMRSAHLKVRKGSCGEQWAQVGREVAGEWGQSLDVERDLDVTLRTVGNC